MKSLDIWLQAINRYETKRLNGLSPFEGNYAGFVRCLQRPDISPSKELLGYFLDIAYKGSSREWSQEQQASWIFALIDTEGFDIFSVKEEGCLFARKMMLDGPPELREKAVAAWVAFTKMVMQQ